MSRVEYDLYMFAFMDIVQGNVVSLSLHVLLVLLNALGVYNSMHVGTLKFL